MAGPYLFPPIGGWGNPAWPWNYQDGIPFIDFQAHRGKALLLRVDAKDVTNVLTFGPASIPGGVMPDLTWSWRGAVTTFHPSASNVSRSSAGDDIPANTWIGDTMETSVNFGRSLFTSADPRNNATTTEGVIQLTDPRGELEYLYEFAWDGATLTILRGNAKDYFSTYGVVAKFTGSAILGGLDGKQIRTRDLGWKLGGLIHDERYTGLGGLEGGAQNKGRWKPYLIGYGFNIEPIPIDTANEIFQWSFTPSAEVFEVKHGGVDITISADYATYELLVAASIPLGQCATCKASSLVRTNFDLQFGIRVDALGDANTLGGHVTPEIRAEIARRIATGYGESKLDEALDIDIQSFSEMAQNHPHEVGFWWGSETTKASALNEIMSGNLGYWHVRPNGQLAIGAIEEPNPNASIQDIEYGDHGMGTLEIIDESMPWPKTLMTWKRNYAPQSRDQLAGSAAVDEAVAAILSAEYRTTISADASVNQLYPTAVPVTIMGNYWNEIDAQNEADRIQSIMGIPRRRYRTTMEIDPFMDVINRVATFKNVNRMYLGAEKSLLCVLVDSLGFGATTTEWWG